jgi:hypothetical protein
MTKPAIARQNGLGIDASALAVSEGSIIDAVNYGILGRDIIDLSRNKLLSIKGMKYLE